MNDGTKKFPSNPALNTFGGCLRDYKNSPVPVMVRVSYIDQTLKVAVDTFHKGKKMVTCFEQKDVLLPTGYHFGVSVSWSNVCSTQNLFSCEYVTDIYSVLRYSQ